MLDLIRPELDRMSIGHVTIEGKTRNRAESIEKFKTDSNTSVFLMSLKAAGTGLTLTEADTVILYDPWWNPMVERQAMDRAHRIGQTKSVNVHKLVTKGTIEERVLSLQEKKKAVFDAVVSDAAEGFKDLTWEDVQGLFGEG
jgi:SNF2 family DNA or RNA helicase